LKNLEELRLQNNYIGSDVSYGILYTILAKLTNLTFINFNELKIGDHGMQSFGVSVLPQLKFLEVLYIDNNGITKHGFKGVSFSNQSNLRILSCSRNELDEEISVEAFKSLKFNSLEKLIVANNKLNSKGIQAILDCIPDNNVLTELNFATNNADMLFSTKEIEVDSIIHRIIKGRDDRHHSYYATIEKVMATLPKLKKLQIINFSMNNLSINPN
jgi:hypothetical protein